MKIAFVVQRYGEGIEGGCEAHCRQIAERLAPFYEVDVLTTCADDYRSWENHFPPGGETLNGVRILRFPVLHPRHVPSFDASYDFLVQLRRQCSQDNTLAMIEHDFISLLTNTHYGKKYRIKALFRYPGLRHKRHLYRYAQQQWMLRQGPLCPQLQAYLQQYHHHYTTIFFFSYNYATTYYSLPLVAKKAVLIPTVHQEDCLAFPIFRETFSLPRIILFNTAAEQAIAFSHYPLLKNKKSFIAGIGIDLPRPADNKLLPEKLKFSAPYLLYVGRVDPAKGCGILFNFFAEFLRQSPHALTLVVIGRAYMEIPTHPQIIYLGYTDEATKAAAMAHALALVVPSFFESLSLVVLESMLMKTPVLVNGVCEVLKEHCEKSDGGLYYDDFESFRQGVLTLLENTPRRLEMAKNGLAYVNAHYSWPQVIARYRQIISP